MSACACVCHVKTHMKQAHGKDGVASHRTASVTNTKTSAAAEAAKTESHYHKHRVCGLGNPCWWDLIRAGHIPSRKIKEAKWTRSPQQCMNKCVCAPQGGFVSDESEFKDLQLKDKKRESSGQQPHINTRRALQVSITYISGPQPLGHELSQLVPVPHRKNT